MEILTYLLENLFFPILVAIIVIYIEKYINDDCASKSKLPA